MLEALVLLAVIALVGVKTFIYGYAIGRLHCCRGRRKRRREARAALNLEPKPA